jgi:SAM-dependent methyltransferase
MNAMSEVQAFAPDFGAIKQRQQATWASGNFAVIGTTLQIVGEMLAESADIRAGEQVLDVAAGNGNATLAAARRFARVTSVDFVPHLLDQGAARAHAEGLDVVFRTADAEQLPFADGQFDVALSTFGAMFTPQQEKTAEELARTVRPGGRIGMANWTPEGFIGQLLKLIGTHLPPPPGLKSPVLWGSEPHVRALFGTRAAEIRCRRLNFNFRYRSAGHWIDVFREYYGPTRKAFEALDEPGRAALAADIEVLLHRLNVAGPDSLVVPSEYLEVVITTK